MPSKLCIKFLHLKDPKGVKISNVLIYIKKLAELPTTSGTPLKLYQTESDSSVVLNFDDDFIFSAEDKYIQVMFIKTDNQAKYLIDQTFLFDTLYKILCQSNSTKQQCFETIHTAILENNYSLTFCLQLCLYTNNENDQKQNAEKLYRTRGHVLSLETLSAFTYCAICSKLIWGFSKQGYKCARCKLVVHIKCCEKIPYWCALAPGQAPILINQNGMKKIEIPHCFGPVQRGFSRLLGYCDHCGSKVWNNILKCTSCNLVIHEKCLGFIPSLCGTELKTLNKQMHNGILKEEFSRTSISDGEIRYSSSSPSSTMSSTSSRGDHQPEIVPQWSDFKCIGRLGQGAFSTVYVAQYLPNCELVTLKVVNSTESEAQDQIKQEKEYLYKFSHDNPYIIKAFCTFHHGIYLFLVTEFFSADTLYERMKKKPLNENEIRYYLIEIISVLQYIHSKHIIYRDLKLEHVVVNSEGHIRLIDYGLAKVLDNNEEICETICGTTGYLAPEIHQLESSSSNDGGYSYTADYWSLGIIFAQLLRNEQLTEMYTYSSNLAASLVKDRNITTEARSLLCGLLEIDRHKRLGSPLSPYGGIREHPFFQGENKIDWSKVDEGVHKSVNRQIIFQESISGSLNNAELSRSTFDRNCAAEWNDIGQSTCTSSDEKRLKSFDSINFKVHSVFSRNAQIL